MCCLCVSHNTRLAWSNPVRFNECGLMILRILGLGTVLLWHALDQLKHQDYVGFCSASIFKNWAISHSQPPQPEIAPDQLEISSMLIPCSNRLWILPRVVPLQSHMISSARLAFVVFMDWSLQIGDGAYCSILCLLEDDGLSLWCEKLSQTCVSL